WRVRIMRAAIALVSVAFEQAIFFKAVQRRNVCGRQFWHEGLTVSNGANEIQRMDPKLLTENGWKPLAQKFKVKDNGLVRALSRYENIPDHKYAERLKAINSVSQLAGALQKDAYVADIPIVARYLDDVI